MATKKGATVGTVIDGGVLTINVEGFDPLVMDVSKIAAVNNERATMHGWKQRIVDASAIGKDLETGLSATPAEKYAAMKTLVDHYMGGSFEWSPGRTEGSKRDEGGITLRALAAVQGVDNETMRARVIAACEKRGITPKTYYAIVATSPDVANKIAEIRAAAVKPGAADDLMLELMGDE